MLKASWFGGYVLLFELLNHLIYPYEVTVCIFCTGMPAT